ncbi:MAG: ARMT1-like domain-containing protein [Candidatus Bathyarchaeota archaeon]|nr:ARMT1-like domain-containing protein [Candidatus Bathyarchaeota archaeon]
MHVTLRCISCILNRGYLQIQEATDDEAVQFKTLSAVLDFLAKEFTPTANPANLGTKRDRIIRKLTGNPDLYKHKKQVSNQKALEVLPIAQSIVSKETTPELRFRKAVLSAIVGNIMEFDLPDNPFKFSDLAELIQQAEADLALDEVFQIYEKAKTAKTIVYLTDNAGEIALDTLLVAELKKLGAHVTVAVKSGPVLNDATLEDAKVVGMDKVADAVVTTGSDAVGLFLEECSEEFLELYRSVDFVIAKGMGHAETLTGQKLPVPHGLLLRSKCSTVANHFGVSTGKNIAKLLH